MFLGKHLQIFDLWRRWSLLCFPIFKFSIKPICFSNLQGFGNPIYNLGDLYWVDLDLSYSDTYTYSMIVVISGRLIWDNKSIGWNNSMFLWKIIFSLSIQQKEGSNDLVGPKYYASSVGVPCCHCRMKRAFQKALKFHTKKKIRTNPQWEILYQKRMAWIKTNKRKKFLMPGCGRLECVTLPNHLYIHFSRSVPSISYM